MTFQFNNQLIDDHPGMLCIALLLVWSYHAGVGEVDLMIWHLFCKLESGPT